jgi:hypothetical protein
VSISTTPATLTTRGNHAQGDVSDQLVIKPSLTSALITEGDYVLVAMVSPLDSLLSP